MTVRRQPRRRGTPDESRERLLVAAAREFNKAGYLGTDSNRLARAAGFAPALFYRHFPNKRAVFLAVYDRWVGGEWDAIGARVRKGGAPAVVAADLVAQVLALHKTWRGLRRSLRVLVASDAVVRRAYQAQRRRQLGAIVGLGGSGDAASRVEAATLLWTLERVADGAADGEVAALGLDAGEVRARLQRTLAAFLAGPISRESGRSR